MHRPALIVAPDFMGQRYLADPATPSPPAAALAPERAAKTPATTPRGPTRASGCASGRQAAHGAVATIATTAARCCARGPRSARSFAVRPRTTGAAALPAARSTNTNAVQTDSWVASSTSADNRGRGSAVPGSDLIPPCPDPLCACNDRGPRAPPDRIWDIARVDTTAACTPTSSDAVAGRQWLTRSAACGSSFVFMHYHGTHTDHYGRLSPHRRSGAEGQFVAGGSI